MDSDTTGVCSTPSQPQEHSTSCSLLPVLNQHSPQSPIVAAPSVPLKEELHNLEEDNSSTHSLEQLGCSASDHKREPLVPGKLSSCDDSFSGYSPSSVAAEDFDGLAEIPGAESLLEAKKKKLLAQIDGAIFRGNSFVENVLDGSNGFGESNGPSLEVQTVDDTVFIDPEPVFRNVEDGSRQVKRNDNQAAGENKRRSRKKGKDSLKSLEKSEMPRKLNQTVEAENGGRHSSCPINAKYSRQEMEAMRFMNIVEQMNIWRSLYYGLEASVVKEYEDLSSSKKQKTIHRNFDPSLHGKVSSENVGNEAERGNVSVGCSHDTEGKGPKTVMEEAYDEEEDSDDDHASIQRPAFYVEGEPDFDSGPPEDGLEYLRRVRWEAARIPKVKVAKPDKHKIVKEQSVYMPEIPVIPRCPDHLLPSKVWEDAFLDDFSQLRLSLARDEDSNNGISNTTQFMDDTPFHLLLENGNQRCPDAGVHPNAMADEDNKSVSSSPPRPTSKGKVDENSDGHPTLSAIRAMDSVFRVSALKKRISSAEKATILSKNECMWLFALCAAVDTPLLGDTSAAIRSLLRKCATLRAAKTELDDDVVMLNILATVCGRYFGQAEL